MSKIGNRARGKDEVGNLGKQLQITDALAKQHEAMTRAMRLANHNQKLEKELKIIDKLALCVEEECNSTIKGNTEKISMIQEELDENICKLRGMECRIADLIKSNEILKKKNCEIERKSRETKNALLKVLQEKEQKMMELREKEEELSHDIKKMSITLQNQKYRIMELEMELEECKVQKFMQKPIAVAKDSNCTDQPKRNNQPNCNSQPKGVNHSLNIHHSKDIDNFHGRIIKIHSESPLSHLTLELVGKNSDECHTSGSSSEQELMEEKSDSCSQTSKEAVITRLKRERDIAKCDVERLQNEILALRKRLEAATDVQMEEKCNYERCLAKEEEKIKKLQSECKDLHKNQSALHCKLQGQEESISKLMTCLDGVKEEKKVDQKTKDLKNLELEYQEKQSEVEQLGKSNAQNRKRYIVTESQLISTKRILETVTYKVETLAKENRHLKTQMIEQENEAKDMKEELVEKAGLLNRLMKKISSLQDDLTHSKKENRRLLMSITEMCMKMNESDSQIERLDCQLKVISYQMQGYKKQIVNLNKEIAELENIKFSQEKERAKLEAHPRVAQELCTNLGSKKDSNITESVCNNVAPEKCMDCEVCNLRNEVSKLKTWNKNLKEVISSLRNVMKSKRKESVEHETSNQELQNEVQMLQNLIQEMQKTLAIKSGDRMQKKGPKLAVDVEHTNRSCLKSPREMQTKPRMALEVENGMNAPSQMKHSHNFSHPKVKSNIRPMAKQTTRHDVKQSDRSHCRTEKPKVSSARGRHETMSPRGRSSSQASKIHVHASISPGSQVNVELEDDDGSCGGEYYSNHSS
ncbi:uncharacterized protein [Hetaerina americana]|uniref:uncharacterized protein n=1 Tax=Hetaerina americana TaxID=62018 RepID=UPI003A7F5A69